MSALAFLGSVLPAVVGAVGGLVGTKNTNDTSIQIAQQNNALQKQMFYDNLQFNSVEAQKTRDYNHLEAMLNRDFQADQSQINRDWESIGSQVQRAYDQGINPQAILSGGMGSSPVQPSSSAASGENAASSGLPSFGLPHLTSPVAAWSLLSDVGLKQAQAENLKADADKKRAEEAGQQIQNSYMPQIIEKGLGVSEAQAKNLSALTDKVNVEIDGIKAQIDDLRSQIQARSVDMTLKDRQRIGQELENFFKGDMFRAQIRNFNASSYRQEQEVSQAWKRLTIEQMIGSAQVSYFGALKDYYGALVNQMGFQNRYYDGMTNLLKWQSQRERQQYLFDTIWTPQERRVGLEEQKYRVNRYEYETGTWYRFTQGWRDILSPVGGIVGGAAGAYVGSKAKRKGISPIQSAVNNSVTYTY